jgi:hypothetical protein
LNSNLNLSEDGNAGHSFKSVKSYILGDLDISSEECDLESFEISSNSSQAAKCTPQSNSTNKRNNSQPSIKKFQEDEEQDCYLRDEAFKGFIAKQSPFSFKNPIFFSCPNNKQSMIKKIDN